jgi:phosphatidylglycerophosphatase A
MKVVKESSDELNPTVVTTAFISRAPGRRGASDYVALAVASCGVGFIPLAPGTWGSLVGVTLFVAVRGAGSGAASFAASRGLTPGQFAPLGSALVLALLIALTLVGVWASTRTEAVLGRKDPGVVVIDEVVGQLITYAFAPVVLGGWAIVLGFVLFRLFDIWKPYPVRRLEALESGLGIMADDVLAGFYAATLLSLACSIYMLL